VYPALHCKFLQICYSFSQLCLPCCCLCSFEIVILLRVLLCILCLPCTHSVQPRVKHTIQIGYLNLRRYMPPSNRHPNSRFCLDRIAQPQLSAIPIYLPSRSARPRRRPRHQTPAARPPALFIPLHTSLRVSNAQALHRQPWPKRSPSPLRASQ
jgi:hypothetical protein